MTQFLQGHGFFVIVVLVFLSVVLLLEGGYLLWRAHLGKDARRLESRMQALVRPAAAPGRRTLFKQHMLSAVPALDRLLQDSSSLLHLEGWIRQAGLVWTVSRLMLTCAVAGLAGWLLLASLLHQPFLIGFAGALLAAGIPAGYVAWRRSQRLRLLEQQLPDALDLLTRALRSGNAFSASLQMIGTEMQEPIASEFRTVHDEINFGISLHQALTNLTTRIPLTDLRYFVVAVLVQRDSGGNLTEILGNLSQLIRGRLKLMAKIKVLAAEGRLSAWVLAVMPFVLAGLMNAMNPAFMAPLWSDPMGQSIVKYTLILMATGIVIMKKIVTIRV